MGYLRGGTILRIDLGSGTIVKEPTAEYEKLWIGGRGLNSRILYTETDPAVNPLGRKVTGHRYSRHVQYGWILGTGVKICGL